MARGNIQAAHSADFLGHDYVANDPRPASKNTKRAGAQPCPRRHAAARRAKTVRIHCSAQRRSNTPQLWARRRRLALCLPHPLLAAALGAVSVCVASLARPFCFGADQAPKAVASKAVPSSGPPSKRLPEPVPKARPCLRRPFLAQRLPQGASQPPQQQQDADSTPTLSPRSNQLARGSESPVAPVPFFFAVCRSRPAVQAQAPAPCQACAPQVVHHQRGPHLHERRRQVGAVRCCSSRALIWLQLLAPQSCHARGQAALGASEHGQWAAAPVQRQVRHFCFRAWLAPKDSRRRKLAGSSTDEEDGNSNHPSARYAHFSKRSGS